MGPRSKRGEMGGTLRCDHPDIEAFIDAKDDPTKLRMLNLSVLVTDVFMAAVRQDDLWDLRFDGTVHNTIRARGLWDGIIRSTFDTAKPGVIFIDRINAANNLYYCENIQAINPLPLHDACPATASSSRSVTTRCNSSTIRFGADACSNASATAR